MIILLLQSRALSRLAAMKVRTVRPCAARRNLGMAAIGGKAEGVDKFGSIPTDKKP